MISEINFLPRTVPSEDWIVVFLVFLLSLLAWIRRRYPRRTQRLIKSFVAASFVKKLKKEEYFISHISTIVLGLIFIALSSLFFWKSGFLDSTVINWKIGGLPFRNLTYLPVFLLFTVLFVSKIFLLKIIDFFSGGNEFLDEYLGNYLVISFFVGILLILPVMGFIFSKDMLREFCFWGVLIIFGFFVVYLIVRGILVAITHKVSIFYII